jgi:hypothetical protein
MENPIRFQFLMALVLLALSCAGSPAAGKNDGPFEPKSSSAFLNYFGGNVFIQMTEQDPKALGYTHRPRSVHISAPLLDAAKNPNGTYRLIKATEDTKLPADAATLRVLEYGTLPRIFQVKSGTMKLGPVEDSGGNNFGKMTLHLDAIVEDPMDGAPDMHIQGDFQVDVSGIS